MRLVKFKGKIWEVLCPINLEFPPGVIRNLLIERGNERIITNISKIKIMTNPGSLNNFL